MTKKIILNNQQKKALTHKKGPLLIIAGAGTGKTTVITEHIKHLIQKKKVSPQNILAATFTDKAANEMLERLDVVMPLGYEEPWLGTFHSICDRILKAESLEIGLDPAYKIITPVEQWMLIKKQLFDFDLKYFRPLGNPTKFISALITFFSRAQDEDVDPVSLLTYAKKEKKKAKSAVQIEEAEKMIEITNAYQIYQNLKIKKSLLDFPDLITKTLELFRKRKSVLDKYKKQFHSLLVDEFQDTNFAQYQLIKLLAPPSENPNLIVVGDDDQSIFKFRGAAISNILDFKKDYPKARNVVLIKNYRSIKPILDSAYLLIQHNNPDRLEVKLKVNKKLKTTNEKKAEKPIIVKTETAQREVDFTLKTILELLAKENYSYKDFAILTRANAYLDAYVAGLKRAGLPYQLVGNRGLFDQEEIRDLISFLRVIAYPEESTSLFQFLHQGQFNLSAEVILSLINQSKAKHLSLWTILKEKHNKKITKIVSLIKDFQDQALSDPVSKLLHNFILKTGYLKQLTREETVTNQLKIKNINLFFERLKRFETENKNAPLSEFIDTLNLWQEAGENPAQAVIEDIDTISLLTVHSAKGLEFPVVFVGNLVSGRFPAINRRDPIEFPEALIKETLPMGSETTQEERRLLYVAMTRAKDYLYLTYASDYGGLRERKPSGFLKETKLKEKAIQPEPLQLSLTTLTPKPVKISHLDKSGEIEIPFLSYSQIDTFLACPLKYKYRYLLKVPAEPHHALTFGATIHNTLHEFHRYEQQGKVLSAPELLSIYKKQFIEIGYESEEHKKQRFQSGIKALKNYHKVFTTIFGRPKILERNFRLNIAGTPFIGKIDRIDETNDGYEIIDYKTGGSKSQQVVDKDKQLTIYGLAAKEAFAMEISKLSLYYIEENKKVTTARDKEQFEKEKKYLKQMKDQIKKSKFRAKPGYPFPCKFCEYSRICPYVKIQ